MGLGRRKIEITDAKAWVFNRMADVYDARPPYPAPLIEQLTTLAGSPTARVVDLGAGIGHLALPLAARGLQVSAVEPAQAMLQRLREQADARGLRIRTLHAKAEDVPLTSGSADLVLIADALHFLDAELVGHEVARLLAPAGVLALLTCEFAPTPFMNALTALMNEAAPRRTRATDSAAQQLSALAGVELSAQHEFDDSTPLERGQLERVLRSISFIGPAMNEARFAAFRERVHTLRAPIWARRFRLRSGHRS